MIKAHNGHLQPIHINIIRMRILANDYRQSLAFHRLWSIIYFITHFSANVIICFEKFAPLMFDTVNSCAIESIRSLCIQLYLNGWLLFGNECLFHTIYRPMLRYFHDYVPIFLEHMLNCLYVIPRVLNECGRSLNEMATHSHPEPI